MKASDKNRAILAEVIARSWREPEYRQQLASNPKQTLKEAGVDIPENHEIDVFENTDNLVYAVLPEMSQMDSHNAAFDAAVSRLRNLPENVEVRIMRDSQNKSHLVLPMNPVGAAIGEMSDAELEQIAGGKTATATYEVAVQTTFEATFAETSSEVGLELIAAVAVALVPCFVS
ncbi:MAG: NHLP leader peptide family RiPP precursor [Myxococcota bacterium]|nr:NHLP leader peptide family RiPP precursor [Myxococcota bacterium]